MVNIDCPFYRRIPLVFGSINLRDEDQINYDLSLEVIDPVEVTRHRNCDFNDYNYRACSNYINQMKSKF